MTRQLVDAFVRALDAAPCSDRRLAREAGLSPALLSSIRNGTRDATPEAVQKIAEALARWGQNCTASADELKAALEHERGNE